MAMKWGWAGLLALLPSVVGAVEWTSVRMAESSIQFVSKQMGVPVEGRFGKFAAQVAFDPAKPANARAKIEIDMASIDAGNADANQEVMGKNWFAVTRYPTATFVATKVAPLPGNRFQVTGQLTLKNITHEVSAPFTFQNGRIEGRYVLKRLDYGIGQGVWADVGTVADEVEVRFSLALSPAGK